MNTNYSDAFGQQVVAEWNSNTQQLAARFGTFESYLAFRRQQQQQSTQPPIQYPDNRYPSPIGQRPRWLSERHQTQQNPPQQSMRPPQQNFGFGNGYPDMGNASQANFDDQNQQQFDLPQYQQPAFGHRYPQQNFGALMGANNTEDYDDNEEYEENTLATAADSFLPGVKMPRIFRQVEEVRPGDVADSFFTVVINFFLSLLFVIVDLITNTAFFAASSLGVFEALGHSNPSHWVFGALLVFSEYLATTVSRRVIKRGWKDIDAGEVMAALALWGLVAFNFYTTYRPLYNLNVGGDEGMAMGFAFLISIVVAFYSERFPTHLMGLVKAYRSTSV